jgi:hypothetical protein
MRIHLVSAAIVCLSSGAASAQEVPVSARMDLWCGTAFVVLTTEAPAGATPEQLAAARTYSKAGKRLIERATPIYLESGYTDDALAELRTTLEASVRATLNGSSGADKPAYGFEDCSSLIDPERDGQ